MKREDFFKSLAESLDMENSNINEASALHLTSLMTLSLMSFLDENFDLRVKVTDLNEIDNVKKLMALIGKDKFV
jgi:acyl carrier protein